MDIVVSGRHCEVSDRFRAHVEEKLARLEKHDHRLIRVEVQVEKEQAKPDKAVRVELTAKSRGPVVRAEAAAEDKMAALDLALDKMTAQMRRAADRRKVHRGQRAPQSVQQALANVPRSTTATTIDDGAIERKVGPGDGDRRRAPRRTREGARGHADHAGAGPLRDGARGPRLLPVRGQGHREALGRLPAPRLRLRGDLARHAAEGTAQNPRICHDRGVSDAERRPAEGAGLRTDPGRRGRRPGAVPARADHAPRCRTRHRGGRRGRRRHLRRRRWSPAWCPTSCCSTYGCRSAPGSRPAWRSSSWCRPRGSSC